MNELATGGKRMTAYGVIAIILGILAMLAPLLTGFSIMTVIGIIVLIAGIVRMVWAFKAGSLGKGIWTFVIGLLTLIAGILLFAHPLFASSVLTVLLVFYFLLDGIFELVAGFQIRPAAGSGWLIFGGVISILLGILIWKQYPLSGVWAIGILFGIKLFLVGLIMLTGGSVMRQIAKE
jgi:uncharacterized membrane protein HdeD (DUF308 family)